nr:hypothetical protein [Mesorhizobium comanense]
MRVAGRFYLSELVLHCAVVRRRNFHDADGDIECVEHGPQSDLTRKAFRDRLCGGPTHCDHAVAAGIVQRGQFAGQRPRCRHIPQNPVSAAVDQFPGARHGMGQARQPTRHCLHEGKREPLHQTRQHEQIEKVENVAWIGLPTDKPDLTADTSQPRLLFQFCPGRALSGDDKNGVGCVGARKVLPKGIDKNVDALFGTQPAEISEDHGILRQSQSLASQSPAVVGGRTKPWIDPVAAHG